MRFDLYMLIIISDMIIRPI